VNAHTDAQTRLIDSTSVECFYEYPPCLEIVSEFGALAVDGAELLCDHSGSSGGAFEVCSETPRVCLGGVSLFCERRLVVFGGGEVLGLGTSESYSPRQMMPARSTNMKAVRKYSWFHSPKNGSG
jgi:hypothetical protein